MEKIRLAEIIATGAHYGQVDKGGEAYINHPATVAMYVNTKDEKIVAWLHDVVEDTDVTISDIKNMFGTKIAQAVDAITRRDNEDRSVYLERVKANKIAKSVKIADLTHNSDLSRIKWRALTIEDFNRADRYSREKDYLEN